MKKILFPTDFSKLSLKALPQATMLARDAGAELLIAHVEEPPATYGAAGLFFTLPAADAKKIEEKLKTIVPSDAAVPHRHIMLSGDAPDAIVACADKENVDMIVMATHGRTGVGHLLMGSIAEQIIRRAKCSVVTVRIPHHQKPE